MVLNDKPDWSVLRPEFSPPAPLHCVERESARSQGELFKTGFFPLSTQWRGGQGVRPRRAGRPRILVLLGLALLAFQAQAEPPRSEITLPLKDYLTLVDQGEAAAKERPALLARPLWPPSRSAPSCIGKSVLAQSAPVAPTAPCDYAKSRIC